MLNYQLYTKAEIDAFRDRPLFSEMSSQEFIEYLEKFNVMLKRVKDRVADPELEGAYIMMLPTAALVELGYNPLVPSNIEMDILYEKYESNPKVAELMETLIAVGNS